MKKLELHLTEWMRRYEAMVGEAEEALLKHTAYPYVSDEAASYCRTCYSLQRLIVHATKQLDYCNLAAEE